MKFSGWVSNCHCKNLMYIAIDRLKFSTGSSYYVLYNVMYVTRTAKYSSYTVMHILCMHVGNGMLSSGLDSANLSSNNTGIIL